MSNKLKKLAATSFAALLQTAAPAFADNSGNGAVGINTTETAGINTTETAGINTTETAGINTTKTAGINTTKTAGINTTKTAGINTTETAGINTTETAGINTTKTIPDHESIMYSCTRVGDPPFDYSEDEKRWCNIPNTQQGPSTNPTDPVENPSTDPVNPTITDTTVGDSATCAGMSAVIVRSTPSDGTHVQVVDTKAHATCADGNPVATRVVPQKTEPLRPDHKKLMEEVGRANPSRPDHEKVKIGLPMKAELPTATEIFIRASKEKETDALRAPVNFANEKTERGVMIAPAPAAFGNK